MLSSGSYQPIGAGGNTHEGFCRASFTSEELLQPVRKQVSVKRCLQVLGVSQATAGKARSVNKVRRDTEDAQTPSTLEKKKMAAKKTAKKATKKTAPKKKTAKKASKKK